MKKTIAVLAEHRRAAQVRGRRDQRLLNAVEAQRRLDAQKRGGSSYLRHPHD
jgi:hypothetical protein